MGLPRELAARLDALASDRTRGAMDLAGDAARLLLDCWQQYPAVELVRRLRDAHPAMAPFLHLERAVTESDDVHAACAGFLARLESADGRIAKFAAPLVPAGGSVVTLSFSRTVLAAFDRAHRAGTRFEVMVCESRPLLEGVALASELAQRGIQTTVIADAAAALCVQTAGAVFAGADTVGTQDVVNKIGTRSLALAARDAGKPCWVLASELKSGDLPPVETPRDPAELLREPPAAVAVRNVYFETTPLRLFTGIVTETGVRRLRG